MPELFEHLNAPTVKSVVDGDRDGEKSEKKGHIEKLLMASEEIKTLYDSICNFIESLGDDISKNQLKMYLAYKKVQNMACVQIYNKQIILFLRLDPDEIQLEKGFTRDMRNIGHYGTGNLQVLIKNAEDFEKAKPLLQKAYNRA